MKQKALTLLIIAVLLSCETPKSANQNKEAFLVKEMPEDQALSFKPELVPDNKLIHQGVFSPDLSTFYFTLSDTMFTQFDVYRIEKVKGKWSEPEKAFFNSEYMEHGISFSADGKNLFFSSTRPVVNKKIADTWHIWKTHKVNGAWTEPEFVEIPHTEDKLLSHPSIANSGTLYFHMSKVDYSEMDIYSSKLLAGKYQFPEKVNVLPKTETETGTCTPFISPEEDFILFAAIGNQLDLMISFNDGKGGWTNTRKLPEHINTKGQGNPYVSPGNEYLFFAKGDHLAKDWSIQCIKFDSILKSNSGH